VLQQRTSGDRRPTLLCSCPLPLPPRHERDAQLPVSIDNSMGTLVTRRRVTHHAVVRRVMKCALVTSSAAVIGATTRCLPPSTRHSGKGAPYQLCSCLPLRLAAERAHFYPNSQYHVQKGPKPQLLRRRHMRRSTTIAARAVPCQIQIAHRRQCNKVRCQVGGPDLAK
jgi:hypothetical protein